MSYFIFNTELKFGGAAIAAYRLKTGLNRLSPGCCYSVIKETGWEINESFCLPVLTREDLIWKEVYIKKILQNRTEISNTYFDLLFRCEAENLNDLFDSTNHVINIHWVAKFLSIRNIGELAKMNMPIVWTLHDEAPYTGGCHYTSGCENFQIDCKKCPQLKIDEYEIPFHTLQFKKNIFPENIVIVTPSLWLKKRAATSSLFKKKRIEVIPNGVDTEVFTDHKRERARKLLKINNDVFLLLFGAVDRNEERKGFRLLIEFIDHLKKDPEYLQLIKNKKIKVIMFGIASRELQETGLGIENVGFVDNENKLSEIYSAADLLILPSKEDNLPNILLESMACGTPVMGFRIGGLPDVIKNNKNGFLIDPFDTVKMAETFMRIHKDVQRQDALRKAARQTILEKYTMERQSEKYRALFDELLLNQKRAKNKKSGTMSTNLKFPPKLISLYQNMAQEIIDKLMKERTSFPFRLDNLILHPVQGARMGSYLLYRLLPVKLKKIIRRIIKKD